MNPVLSALSLLAGGPPSDERVLAACAVLSRAEPAELQAHRVELRAAVLSRHGGKQAFLARLGKEDAGLAARLGVALGVRVRVTGLPGDEAVRAVDGWGALGLNPEEGEEEEDVDRDNAEVLVGVAEETSAGGRGLAEEALRVLATRLTRHLDSRLLARILNLAGRRPELVGGAMECVGEVARVRPVDPEIASLAVDLACTVLRHSTLKVPPRMRNAVLRGMSAVLGPEVRHVLHVQPSQVVVLAQAASVEVSVGFEKGNAVLDPRAPENESVFCAMHVVDALVDVPVGDLDSFTEAELTGLLHAVDRTLVTLCSFVQADGSGGEGLGRQAVVSCVVSCLSFFLRDDEESGAGLLAAAKTGRVANVLPWMVVHASPELVPAVVGLMARLWVFSQGVFEVHATSSNVRVGMVTRLARALALGGEVGGECAANPHDRASAGLALVCAVESLNNVPEVFERDLLAQAVDAARRCSSSSSAPVVLALVMRGVALALAQPSMLREGEVRAWFQASQRECAADLDEDDESHITTTTTTTAAAAACVEDDVARFEFKAVRVLRRLMIRGGVVG